jgi:integrase/recombinase XerD
MVQVLLGHVSITSTEIYTHLEQKQLEDTMKRYHPQALK